MGDKRLFFALWPEAAEVRVLAQWARRAGCLLGGRRMRPETLHLTLVFLGTVPSARVPEVQDILRADASWPGGTLTLDGFGRFAGPAVVWAGPTQPVPWLFALRRQLVAGLHHRGLPVPDEPFRPHVSLLRRAGAGELALLGTPRPLAWTPKRLVLVASQPDETGSNYTFLAQACLSASRSL